MNKLLVAMLAIVAACLSVSVHAATVINFDDLRPDHNANFGPNFAVPPPNYGGLTWVNTIVEAASSFIPGSLNLNVSAPNVATDSNYLTYNLNAAPIQFSAATPFTFRSVYLIANQVEDLNISVKGLLDGVVVDTRSFVVGTSTPVLGVFNWSNIDTVIMSSSGGNDPRKHKSFTFDNVVVGSVPEPASCALMLAGMGVLALAGVRPRCRREDH